MSKNSPKPLVQDHKEAYRHLSELAAKAGIPIPKGINSARISSIQQLTRLKGDRFDRAFAKEEAASDRQPLVVFKREAVHGHDTDVEDSANKGRMFQIGRAHLISGDVVRYREYSPACPSASFRIL